MNAGRSDSRIGIGAIAVALPETRLATHAQAQRLGIDADRLERRLGFRGLARMGAGQDTSDLALAAVNQLMARGLEPSSLEYLCVVTQNPDGAGLPPVSALLHGKLGLSARVAAFDLSHGCAGFVYGLAISKAFMEAQGFRTGLLITADPYSKIVDSDDPKTALIFGDAATASVLSADYVWEVGRSDFGTDGSHCDALHINPSGHLRMNGQRIARICATAVPQSILRALALNEIQLADVDEVLLHQASRYIIETIGEALQTPEKTKFYAADYGNVISSSLPLALSAHVLPSVRRLALCGFGVGLSWASTLLTRRQAGIPEPQVSICPA